MEMDIYMRRRLVALGGLVAFFIIFVLLVKSCGGDDEPAPQEPTGATGEGGAVPLTTQDFTAQADQICATANAAVGAIDPESPTAVREEYQITSDELTSLQQLQVDDDSPLLRRFFAELETVVASLRDKQRAVQSGDTVADGEAQAALDTAEAEARDLGSRYGFRECGQFLDAGEQPNGGGGAAATGTEPGTVPTEPVVPTETTPAAPTDTGAAPTETPAAPPEDSGGGISP